VAPSTSAAVATSPAVTTTTVAPTTTTFPRSFGVGFRTITLVDKSRATFNYDTSPPSVLSARRTIVTQVRYPIYAAGGSSGEQPGATPASDGPFPVIVFAHGYAVMPNTYQLLLDSWVEAGFVVVAPVFPVSNYYEWLREGGGSAPEDDVVNQPYDLAFVVRRLFALEHTGGSFLDGLVDMSRFGFAGQSDGATTIGGLVYGDYWKPTFASMPVRPHAVAILSGAEFGGGVAYADPVPAPGLLSVESDSDYCNPTPMATKLYNDVAGGSASRWFLTLHGATHSGPYFGVEPWAAAVRNVTTDFFELELRARDRRITASTLESAGGLSGISSISDQAEVTLPVTTAEGECGEPSPSPPAGV